MSIPMSAAEAWVTLGKNPQDVFTRLSKLPRNMRAAAAQDDLVEAKKLAKQLMALHHPDRGGSTILFQKINAAIISIEAHTTDFVSKINAAIARDESKPSNRTVFIKLG